MNHPNLEVDLNNSVTIKEKLMNLDYATRLYGALCNIIWYKGEDLPENEWGCSWRYAGGVVADLRDVSEDYMDFYCSGNEGLIDDEIEEDLLSLGWKWKHHPLLK